MSAPSAEVLARAVAGERTAVDRLLLDWRPDLSRYARRHCQSEDVEDAVQDALLIIATRVAALRAFSAFAGWSFRIVKRICLRMMRGRVDQIATDDGQLETPATQDLRVAVREALLRIPEPQRRAVVLKDVLGFSADEMARSLDVPLESAKGRLHRGRLAIREELRGWRDGLR